MSKVFTGILSVSLILSALVLGCSKSEPPAPAKDPSPPSVQAVTKPAPDFSVTTLDGKPLKLSDLRGKVVLVDFWATWCPPCRASIPHLMKLQEKHKDKGLTVVGLSLDVEPDDLKEFVAKQGINYSVAQCPIEVKEAYRVSSIPRMFIIDKNGGITGDFLGYSEQIGDNIESAALAALNR